jgi:hypothetical protein
MFQVRNEIAEAVDKVYALTMSLGRGDVLTHEAVSAVLGVGPDAYPWKMVIRKVERRLEKDRGIAFWPNHRDGKKLCTVSEQLRLPAERLRRAGRQVRKGRRSINAIPTGSMTMHQRRIQAFQADMARNADLAIRRDIKSMSAETPEHNRTPRRPVVAS